MIHRIGMIVLIGVFGLGVMISTAKDPVPGLLEKLKNYPGLESAINEVVFNSPYGRIHGHDAQRIDFAINSDATEAIVVVVLPESFTIHKDRILICKKIKKKWECEEMKILE